MQTFTDVHRWADIKMGNYIARPRIDNAVAPSRALFKTLQRDNAFELFANNAEARIAFAEIAIEHVLAHDGIALGPVCFVTITPAACAREVGDAGKGSIGTKSFYREIGQAARYDVVQLQQIARQGMGDVPFIGMVEMALYRRWGPKGRAWGDWVSWHCHLLAWGVPQPELSAALAPLRARHASMREDLASVHVQDVPRKDVARQFLYALKAPQKLYRVEEFKRPWTNPSTGEVKQAGLHMQKDWLQTGQRLRCVDIMGERTLDKLLFGGRAGVDLVAAVRDEALTTFRQWESKQPWAQRN